MWILMPPGGKSKNQGREGRKSMCSYSQPACKAPTPLQPPSARPHGGARLRRHCVVLRKIRHVRNVKGGEEVHDQVNDEDGGDGEPKK